MNPQLLALLIAFARLLQEVDTGARSSADSSARACAEFLAADVLPSRPANHEDYEPADRP